MMTDEPLTFDPRTPARSRHAVR